LAAIKRGGCDDADRPNRQCGKRGERTDSGADGLGSGYAQQAKLIMVAAANAAVTNIEEFEVRDSAQRIAGELKGMGKRENHSSDVR
jgi:hypothetical protein